MISPRTAQRLIARHTGVLGTKRIAIDHALGHVLAENIRSPLALPVFDNSAMDGFAVRSRDTIGASRKAPIRLTIIDTVFAGGASKSLRARTACRIMTGAPLPRGADAVIPVEAAIIEGSALVATKRVERYRHVRRRGEEIKRGTRVLKKGEVLHPGAIAILATLGKPDARVIRKPRVSVISTGDEAVPPGARLARGQIYDSNSHMMAAMLRQMGINPVRRRRVKDHPTALRNAVTAALEASDVLIVIGGVSMGDRDYVRRVLGKERVRQIFWRVAQKPGKPLFFGVKGAGREKRLVFGLPGNPASAFTCFYVYVYPALRQMAGFRDVYLPKRTVRLGAGVKRDAKKWRLLKGKMQHDRAKTVSELPKQGSHMITSLAETNGLIVVPPGEDSVDDALETYQLPYAEDTP
jgi:molybdopterin molybdotransferase